jgi:hypothetical protein
MLVELHSKGLAMQLLIVPLVSVSIIGILGSGAFAADKVTCFEERESRKTFCFDPKQVRANGSLRAFTLYTGGPNGVSKTTNTGVFNCQAGYMELRDHRGVIFARDQPEKSHVIRLRDSVCAIEKPRNDPALR